MAGMSEGVSFQKPAIVRILQVGAAVKAKLPACSPASRPCHAFWPFPANSIFLLIPVEFWFNLPVREYWSRLIIWDICFVYCNKAA